MPGEREKVLPFEADFADPSTRPRPRSASSLPSGPDPMTPPSSAPDAPPSDIEASLATWLNASPHGIVVVRFDRTILWSNAAARTLEGVNLTDGVLSLFDFWSTEALADFVAGLTDRPLGLVQNSAFGRASHRPWRADPARRSADSRPHVQACSRPRADRGMARPDGRAGAEPRPSRRRPPARRGARCREDRGAVGHQHPHGANPYTAHVSHPGRQQSRGADRQALAISDDLDVRRSVGRRHRTWVAGAPFVRCRLSMAVLGRARDVDAREADLVFKRRDLMNNRPAFLHQS